MLHTHIVLLKRIHVSALISSSLLLVLLALAFFPVASSSSDTLAAPAPSETTLSMTAENINLDLSVDNPNGTFNASDPASLTVATNNYTGYTLSILASTSGSDASKLVNGAHEFSSISTTSSANDFNNGNWGLLPSKVNSAANSSYIPAPTTEGTTLDATNSANVDANSYTLALGAKADYTLPAGRYSNTFVVVAVANPVGYSITYDDNTTDEVGNMPANQAGDLEDTDITISSNVPTRTGYTFNNWCDDTVTATNGIDSCAGNIYEPGDTFATSMQTTNNLTLTAMWNRTYTIVFEANDGTGTMPDQRIIGSTATLDENLFTRSGYDFDGWNTEPDGTGTAYADEDTFTVPASGTSTTLYAQWGLAVVSFDTAFSDAGKTKITANDGNNYYQMQDMTTTICNAVTTPTAADYSDTPEARLVDNRDKKVYWVAKLKDGKCWMTQNLDHDIVKRSNYYTPNNTDITENWTPRDATIIATSESFSGFSKSTNYPQSVDVGDWYWLNDWYVSDGYRYLTNGENEKFKKSPFAGNDEHGHVGNYYNWTAAVAMNNTASYSSSTYDNPNNSPQTSICPKGWRLPVITTITLGENGQNDFYNLVNNYGGSTMSDTQFIANPLYFVRGGKVDSSTSLSFAGHTGYYWSSTVNDSYQAYSLDFHYTTVSPRVNHGRADGYSIRCVAR